MSGEKKTVSEFEKLIGEIGDIHKALPTDGDTKADDEKIEAAAGDADGDVDGDADGAGDGKDGEVTKSFEVTLANGEKAEAFDATAILKSLSDRVETTESGFVTAMRQMLDVVKSLQGQVTKLSSAGKGRKAVLTVHEKTTTAGDVNKSEDNTMSADEFMGKALVAQKEGRVSGTEIAIAEANLNRGQQVPVQIVKKVLGL